MGVHRGTVIFHMAYPQWRFDDPHTLPLSEFRNRFEHYNERYDRDALIAGTKNTLRPVEPSSWPTFAGSAPSTTSAKTPETSLDSAPRKTTRKDSSRK